MLDTGRRTLRRTATDTQDAFRGGALSPAAHIADPSVPLPYSQHSLRILTLRRLLAGGHLVGVEAADPAALPDLNCSKTWPPPCCRTGSSPFENKMRFCRKNQRVGENAISDQISCGVRTQLMPQGFRLRSLLPKAEETNNKTRVCSASESSSYISLFLSYVLFTSTRLRIQMSPGLTIVERSNGGGGGGGRRVGRAFWYLLPVACVFWFTLLAFHRQSYIPITTTTIATTIIITTNTTTTTTANTTTATTITTRAKTNTNTNTNTTITKTNTNTNTNTTITKTNPNTSDADDNNRDGVAAVAASRRPLPIVKTPPDTCSGRYVYVHDLPRRFNTDMLRDCRSLSRWTNMCKFTTNAGLGPPLGRSGGVFSGSGSWYATDQFALDVIFYNRMKQYACLTNDSSRASAVFVPFFAGLDVARYLWGDSASARDSASLDLIRWLRSRREWAVMGGRDHFVVAGRIAWDFRRLTDSDLDWGNKLLVLPEARNMSVLVLESSPWHANDFAIPYPTYFHPSKDVQVLDWQKRMRRTKRPWLFSFAGAPRPNQADSIRGRIIEQCQASRRCRLLDCGAGAKDCYAPARVMRAFQSSTFCLQPTGDSYTRRSAFDAMVAGCVPVFFHPGSAYVQYLWHLPRDYRGYSVFIPEGEVREGKVAIEERLARIPEREVRAMRAEVIRMIPRLVYANPRAGQVVRVKDAFEVAVEGVIERVNRLRKEMRGEVAAPPLADDEHDNWKIELVGDGGPHEWDRFFTKPQVAMRS